MKYITLETILATTMTAIPHGDFVTTYEIIENYTSESSYSRRFTEYSFDIQLDETGLFRTMTISFENPETGIIQTSEPFVIVESLVLFENESTEDLQSINNLIAYHIYYALQSIEKDYNGIDILNSLLKEVEEPSYANLYQLFDDKLLNKVKKLTKKDLDTNRNNELRNLLSVTPLFASVPNFLNADYTRYSTALDRYIYLLSPMCRYILTNNMSDITSSYGLWKRVSPNSFTGTSRNVLFDTNFSYYDQYVPQAPFGILYQVLTKQLNKQAIPITNIESMSLQESDFGYSLTLQPTSIDW